MFGDEVPHTFSFIEVHSIDDGFQLIQIGSKTEHLEVDLLALTPHIEAMISHHPRYDLHKL